MKIVCSLFLLLVTAFAQNRPGGDFTIKGYTFGESLLQVLTKSGEPNRVDFCRDYVATHPIKERSRDLSHFRLPSQKEFKKELDAEMTVHDCETVLQAAQNNYAEVMLKGGGTAIFEAGKLVGFEILFLNTLRSFEPVPYEKVLADAINKYGDATNQGTTTWENGFGATVHPRFAVWVLQNSIVYVEESAKNFGDINDRPADVTVTAALKTAIEHVRKEAVKGPNVLDGNHGSAHRFQASNRDCQGNQRKHARATVSFELSDTDHYRERMRDERYLAAV
jgi:hypothetical protein